MNSSTHPYEREEVMAYLDGELSADRASGVAAHLRECAECAELAEQMRGVSVHLANWSVEPAPATFATGLEAARKERALPKVERRKGIAAWLDGRFAPLGGRWAWGVGSAVAVAVLLLVIGRPNSLRAPDAARLASEKIRSATESKQLLIPGAPAPPVPVTGRNYTQSTAPAPPPSDNASQMAELYRERAQISESLETNPEANAVPQAQPPMTVPMIARTASVSVIVKDFGPVEATVKAIAQRHNGYIASLNTASPQDAARTLSATLQIPSAQLESAVTELKQLGRVDQETQSGEEVTKEFTDRVARLKNARATEQRLLDVLREHTGKVKDILEAEQEIARVRGEIEQMEADQRALQTRIDFATVQLSVQEEYKASLQSAPPSTARRLRNAAVEGYRSLVESVIGIGVFSLQAVPILLLWGIILFIPTRWMWKRFRRTAAPLS
jgi:anti-sigma factor RsiW